MADRITSDHVPAFFGVAEADNMVTVVIDGVAGRHRGGRAAGRGRRPAAPERAYAGIEGNWRIETNLNLADGEH